MEEITKQNQDIQSSLGKMMDLFTSLKKDVDDLKATRSAADEVVEDSRREEEPDRSRRGSRSPSRSRGRSSSRGSSRRPRKRLHSGSRSRSRSPIHVPRSWADIMSDLDDQEQESISQTTTGKLVAVSESTATTLDKYFSKSLKNSEQLQLRDKYGLPKVPSTKTPQMEPFLKEEVNPAAKTADKELARIHTYLLDAVAPLTAIMDRKVTESDHLHPEVLTAIHSACQLVGNASAKLANLRREKVMTSLNKGLLPLVKDEQNFTEAAPGLFGAEFAEKCKKHVEQVKAMRFSLSKGDRAGSSDNKRPFFRQGPPPNRGGGGIRR